MPRKAKVRHPIRDLRKIIGKTQREFAATIGVSASALKQIENRKRPLNPTLARQIRLEAGVDDKALLNGELLDVMGRKYKPKGYYVELGFGGLDHYENWKEFLAQNDKIAREQAGNLFPWIEILVRASAVGSKRRLWQVSEAVICAINDCRKQFGLIRATDEILKREYQVTDEKRGVGRYQWYPQGRGDKVARLWREKSQPEP